MMRTVRAACGLMLFVIAMSAQAQQDPRWAVDVGFQSVRYEDTLEDDYGDRLDVSYSPRALSITGSYAFNPSLSLEASIGLELSDDDLTSYFRGADGESFSVPTDNVELSTHPMGVFLAYGWQVSERVRLYARGGLFGARRTVNFEDATSRFELSEIRLSGAVGGGMLFDFTPNTYLRADWTRSNHSADEFEDVFEDASVNAFAVGVGRRF